VGVEKINLIKREEMIERKTGSYRERLLVGCVTTSLLSSLILLLFKVGVDFNDE